MDQDTVSMCSRIESFFQLFIARLTIKNVLLYAKRNNKVNSDIISALYTFILIDRLFLLSEERKHRLYLGFQTGTAEHGKLPSANSKHAGVSIG